MAGWLAVGGVAALYDWWAVHGHHDTLSRAAGRHPFITAAACAGLFAHFNSHRFKWRAYVQPVR